MAKKLDIAKLRKRLNLSQAALARRLGVDQSTVQRIEAGKRPPSGPVQMLLEQIAAQQ
jgi:DNA-binding transcriptional regulator YiaG